LRVSADDSRHLQTAYQIRKYPSCNPTTSLDLEPWLMSLSVRQESPVVSLLYPCHQPKRLSNRVGF
jgi:hypothetical protein